METATERDLAAFQEKIAYTFNDKTLLEELFVHTSFLHEQGRAGMQSNERLEFLGDAVLSTVISHLLIERYPAMNEGELSRLRARLVSEKSFSALARELSLGDYLLLGRGEERDGGRQKPSLLADTFEALVAALYLDGGFETVFAFVAVRFDAMVDSLAVEVMNQDYKTLLQELTQGAFRVVPDYRVVDERGPDHDRRFTVEVLVKGEVRGTGVEGSKKAAQQRAAKEALEGYKREA